MIASTAVETANVQGSRCVDVVADGQRAFEVEEPLGELGHFGDDVGAR